MYNCEYCSSLSDLRKFLELANDVGYEIIAMTEESGYGYTIIYKINEII